MAKCIGNFQIKNALKNTNDDDIDDNFVGVFPSNHMNKFIDNAAMISEKRESIPSLYRTLIALKRKNTLVEHT